MSGRKESKQLYDLIKSLSGSEKRYFKLYASNHVMASGNKSIELFDQIDRQQSPEEDVKGQQQKISRHLPRIRQYLYALILKSLDAYYAENSIAIKIRKMLNSIEILFAKGLNEQCLKIIKKAKELAALYELDTYIYEINTWEINLKNRLNIGNVFKVRVALYKEQDLVLERLRQTFDYLVVSGTVLALQKIVGNSLPAQKIKALNKMVDVQLISAKCKGSGFRVSYAYLSSNAIYASTSGDHAGSYLHRKQMIELYEKYPQHIENQKRLYINTHINLLGDCKSLRKYKECALIIEKIRGFNKRWPETEKDTNEGFFQTLINTSIAMEEFEKGPALALEIDAFYKKHENKVDRNLEVLAYYNLCVYFFVATDYKRALYYCNKVLNYKELEIRKDIGSYTRVLNLVINYELKNYQLIEYNLQSFSVFLKKINNKNRVEKALIAFFHKLININDTKEEIAAFKLYKQDLGRIIENPKEKIIIGYFNLMAWAESKIRKTTLTVIAKEMNWY